MEADIEDGAVTVIDSASSLMALNRSEIDIQIATAKQYPRSLKRFMQEATEMATLDEEIAEGCMYSLPRSGKNIEGPSARLAEIVASAWGNCRAGARVIGEDGNFVTAQGVFLDLQRNVAITYEVKRRITDSQGRRYKDDMIGVTANAACSIALRNAVFKGVPKPFWKKIYDAARKTAIGDSSTLADRRAQMLVYFQKLGASEDKVFALLGVKGVEDIGLDELGMLKGLATAIKEGDTDVDKAFSQPTNGSPGEKTLELNEKLRAIREAKKDPNAQGGTHPVVKPEVVSQSVEPEPETEIVESESKTAATKSKSKTKTAPKAEATEPEPDAGQIDIEALRAHKIKSPESAWGNYKLGAIPEEDLRDLYQNEAEWDLLWPADRDAVEDLIKAMDAE